jgi:Transcription factor WhiB
MSEARCLGAPLELFVPREAEQTPPPPEVLAYCDPCPVAAECLAWALRWRGTVGYFGGTSTRQRRALWRPRPRLRCPACHGRELVELDGVQVCGGCARSWRAAS